MQQDNTDFEPEIHSVLITDRLPTFSTFGHADDGGAVFIPAVVARAAQLEPGDTVMASLVPNNHTSGTPWFAMHVHGPGEEISVDVWKRMSDDVLLAALKEGPLTTRELAEELDVPNSMVNSRMNALFREQQVVKAAVFADPRKGASPTAVLWGTSVDDFLEEEE